VKIVVSVGDLAMASPLQWEAGAVSILSKNGQVLVAPPERTKQESFYQELLPISHTFRPPHQPPPSIITMIAAVAIFVPLLGFFGALIKLRANISGSYEDVYAILFLTSIAGALVLAVWFWLRMQLVDLFLSLGGLSLFMVAVGHRALVNVADERIAADAKARKAD
jgi:hypothetical protein